MMVLLFLLALLLAVPTIGLSIVAFVAFALCRSYLIGKSHNHYINEHEAANEVLSGAEYVPSWAGNKDESLIFVDGLQRMTIKKGVPQAFLWALFDDDDTFGLLISLAGSMERKGASFTEQQIAVSEKLIQIWERAPAKLKSVGLNPKEPG